MKTKPTLGPRRFPRTVEGLEAITAKQMKSAGLPRSSDELNELIDERIQMAFAASAAELKTTFQKLGAEHPLCAPVIDLGRPKEGGAQ